MTARHGSRLIGPYAQAIEDGMEPHEAWGGSEGESPVSTSEEDQLSLGEDPNQEPEPTPVAEFPALRITEVLRRPSEPGRLSSAHSERTKWLQEVPRTN
jgi:hypothetical protein